MPLFAVGCTENEKEAALVTENEKTNEEEQTKMTAVPEATPTPSKDPDEDLPYISGKLKRVSVHDPSIIATADSNGKKLYYIYGSHISGAKSADLANWTNFTNGYATKNNTLYGKLSENLAGPFSWAGENDSDCKGGFAVWAPHIIYNEYYVNEDGSRGAYMDYFCTSSTYCRSAIGFAVSQKVDGDFVCKGILVCSGFTQKSAKDKNSDKDKIWTNTNIDELMAAGKIDEGFNTEWGSGTAYNTDYAPNAIDPAILFDKEGRMWMSYGSWSGGIYMLELDRETGEAIYPKSNGKTEDGRVIDKYFGVRIAGGHTKSGEGPYIIYDEATDYYYLLTTYNYLDSVSGYNMRLFRSQNPTGPYVDAKGNNAVFPSKSVNMYNIGIKVMGNYAFSCHKGGYRSPGHCSAFKDDDGQMYLIYHTRFASGGEVFQTRVHPQFMNEQAWPVTAVFENRGDKISETGYPIEQIVGEYEFINHGTASDGASVKTPVNITLSEDGKITGDVTGTWSEKKDSYMASFTLDNVKYYGVFFKQHDEASVSKLVMTFTAIGENNETIWGVRKP
ncbi:MAG: glycoside hydrolase family 43 protein [Lachnospiraceae bacterium]|nr:glycoside hydrolase family 43 protein [Lachnospiraceae bacterium]